MLFVRVPGCSIKFSPRDCVDFVAVVVAKVQLFVALLGTEVRELVRRPVSNKGNPMKDSLLIFYERVNHLESLLDWPSAATFRNRKLQNISSENKVEASVREEQEQFIGVRYGKGRTKKQRCQHLGTKLNCF